MFPGGKSAIDAYQEEQGWRAQISRADLLREAAARCEAKADTLRKEAATYRELAARIDEH